MLSESQGLILATQVVIDKDILGWADEHKEELRSAYQNILAVGKHPDLPQRSSDKDIATYCKQKGCDLITGDAKSYTYFFSAGISWVKISQRDLWKKADKAIYLVQIQK